MHFKKNLMFIHEREGESVCERGRGRERKAGTESKAGSRLRAVSTDPHMGLELKNYEIMTWAEVRHLIDWATQAPLEYALFFFFFKFINFYTYHGAQTQYPEIKSHGPLMKPARHP